MTVLTPGEASRVLCRMTRTNMSKFGVMFASHLMYVCVFSQLSGHVGLQRLEEFGPRSFLLNKATYAKFLGVLLEEVVAACAGEKWFCERYEAAVLYGLEHGDWEYCQLVCSSFYCVSVGNVYDPRDPRVFVDNVWGADPRTVASITWQEEPYGRDYVDRFEPLV